MSWTGKQINPAPGADSQIAELQSRPARLRSDGLHLLDNIISYQMQLGSAAQGSLSSLLCLPSLTPSRKQRSSARSFQHFAEYDMLAVQPVRRSRCDKEPLKILGFRDFFFLSTFFPLANPSSVESTSWKACCRPLKHNDPSSRPHSHRLHHVLVLPLRRWLPLSRFIPVSRSVPSLKARLILCNIPVHIPTEIPSCPSPTLITKLLEEDQPYLPKSAYNISVCQGALLPASVKDLDSRPRNS